MLNINPEFSSLIPPLTDAEFETLEQSILHDGIRDAIVTWNGYIIDGHNRYKIAQKHGLQFTTIEMQFESIYDVKDWMFANQLGRRNLTELQKTNLIGQRYNNQKQRHGGDRKSKAQNELLANTAETIADEYNVSRETVKRAADFATGLDHTTPELKQDILQGKVKVNKDDVQQLAKAEPTFTATSPAEILKEANRIKSERKKKRMEAENEKRKQLAADGATKIVDIDFRLGDFEDVFSDIPDGSIDCIITDPPYPYEFIECWTKLGRFAKRVLKPNGFCIAYSGQMYLPEVMQRMSEHLDYYWTFAVYHTGGTQIVNGVNIMCRWKPVLIFQNGKRKLENTMQDYFISEQREKDGHEWQQSKSGVAYLVEMFTNPDDLICDPFAGSATTLIQARNMQRRIIGAEINLTTYNIARALL